MSERRAKQARRLQRLLETGRPERQTKRLPKHASEPSLIGWNKHPLLTWRGEVPNRAQEKARRRRQRFTVLAGVPFYEVES